MTYTIPTRCNRNGIYFDPHVLEPLGIREGSLCWGIVAEGNGFDSKVQLVSHDDCYQNESPHLVISPIHHQRWVTAFGIKIYLQRRSIPLQNSPETVEDAVLGLADALVRCGVNILFMQTAQMGYDLLAFDATCELPRLRLFAKAVLEDIDIEAAAVDEKRLELRGRNASDAEFAAVLVPMSEKLSAKRIRAFQKLGRVVIHELADLEARLYCIDRKRSRYWQLASLKERSRIEDTEFQTRAMQWNSSAGFRLVVGDGYQAETLQDDIKRNLFGRALTAPWFLSPQVCSAGENAYFLSYEAIRSRKNAENLIPLEADIGQAKIKESYVKAMTEFHAKRWPTELHEDLFQTFRYRELPPFMTKILKLEKDSASVIPSIPGVRERILRNASEPNATSILQRHEESEKSSQSRKTTTEHPHDEMWYEDFFRRQSYNPIQITTLSTLAFARFWAFGGTGEGTRGEPIRFRYQDRLLIPENVGDIQQGYMADLFKMLNDTTQCERGVGKRGKFGPETAALANINLEDRFMRIRFVREISEFQAYVTVSVTYNIREANLVGPNSMGLFLAISQLLLKAGFRIERCSNSMKHSNSVSESGTIDVIGRANSSVAEVFCRDLQFEDGRVETQAAWSKEIIEVMRLDLNNRVAWNQGGGHGIDARNVEKIEVTITPGFVPIRP